MAVITLDAIGKRRKEDLFVTHCWKNAKTSRTIITSIPHRLADKYGIQANTNLVLIDTAEGIMLKKLKVAKE